MKYAELKADNERLRTQLADLVNAVAALREQWRNEAGPRMEDSAENFPAGHDMTERAFVLHEIADKLAAILDSRKG